MPVTAAWQTAVKLRLLQVVPAKAEEQLPHRLQPYGLPDAGGSRVEDAGRLPGRVQALLPDGDVRGICRIICLDQQLLLSVFARLEVV